MLAVLTQAHFRSVLGRMTGFNAKSVNSHEKKIQKYTAF
jgi:hypothetical protein